MPRRSREKELKPQPHETLQPHGPAVDPNEEFIAQIASLLNETDDGGDSSRKIAAQIASQDAADVIRSAQAILQEKGHTGEDIFKPDLLMPEIAKILSIKAAFGDPDQIEARFKNSEAVLSYYRSALESAQPRVGGGRAKISKRPQLEPTSIEGVVARESDDIDSETGSVTSRVTPSLRSKMPDTGALSPIEGNPEVAGSSAPEAIESSSLPEGSVKPEERSAPRKQRPQLKPSKQSTSEIQGAEPPSEAPLPVVGDKLDPGSAAPQSSAENVVKPKRGAKKPESTQVPAMVPQALKSPSEVVVQGQEAPEQLKPRGISLEGEALRPVDGQPEPAVGGVTSDGQPEPAVGGVTSDGQPKSAAPESTESKTPIPGLKPIQREPAAISFDRETGDFSIPEGYDLAVGLGIRRSKLLQDYTSNEAAVRERKGLYRHEIEVKRFGLVPAEKFTPRTDPVAERMEEVEQAERAQTASTQEPVDTIREKGTVRVPEESPASIPVGAFESPIEKTDFAELERLTAELNAASIPGAPPSDMDRLDAMGGSGYAVLQG